MPRQLRIEYAGARYHVMSRGNRREYSLGLDDDKKLFLETLEETVEATGWLVHSYVLMGNHFHLLLETPEPNLSFGMRWLQGTYGTRYNRSHGLVGHVWQGRYKSPVISDEGDEHFISIRDYIHLNPVVSGALLQGAEVLLDYPWSSFPSLCSAPAKRPGGLVADTLFRAYGLPRDTAAYRRKYRERMELKCREALQGDLTERQEKQRRELLRGWYIGEATFRDRLKDRLEGSFHGQASSYTGAAKRAHDEQAARDMIDRCLAHFQSSRGDMKKRKPGDLQKRMLAALLRKHTSMTRAWIIHEIQMGSVSSVYHAVKAMESCTGAEKRAWKHAQKFALSLH